MNRYLVEYYYLATGMEGIPDRRVEGIVNAENADEAKDLIIAQNYSMYNESDKRWIRGCLTAHLLGEES